MTLTSEAAYLYILSRQIYSINKKLRRSAKKADKHKKKYEKATTEEKRHKHRIKHTRVSERITQLLKEHNNLLNRLKYRHRTFVQELYKEHRLR